MLEQIEDALKAMKASESMMGNYEDRKLGRTEVGKLIVSTAYTPDMGYETAILQKGTGVHPVERYTSKDLAELGHEKWVNDLPNLKEIKELGYYSLAEESIIKLNQ